VSAVALQYVVVGGAEDAEVAEDATAGGVCAGEISIAAVVAVVVVGGGVVVPRASAERVAKGRAGCESEAADDDTIHEVLNSGLHKSITSRGCAAGGARGGKTEEDEGAAEEVGRSDEGTRVSGKRAQS
jgi:hypothetical protein